MVAQGTGNVRHELHTPLNHIIGYSEMLLEELGDAAVPLHGSLREIGALGRALLDYVSALSDEEAASAGLGQLPESEWRAATEGIAVRCDELGQTSDGAGVPEGWCADLRKIAEANRRLVGFFVRGLRQGEPSTVPVGPGPAPRSGMAGMVPVQSGELLVVDDNEANRELLVRRLTRAGYVVTTARNGREALESVGLKRFELVLLDLMMPEINGIEVLKAIRRRYSHTDLPVIMVTAKSASEDMVQALECGANDYVTKPVDFPVVRARISTQLSLHRLTRELEIANEKLRAYSYLDGLTGIANRRHFDEYLTREWARAARTRHPLSLIFVDVDHFKLYNDSYGHEAGDRVLKQVATALSSGLMRGGDLVARYGGEEFVAVLPQTPVKAAMELAELLRTRVAGLKIPHGKSPGGPHVTASFGVCSMVPEPGRGSDVLLQGADRALYHAKKRARDCISCAGNDAAGGECRTGCAVRPEGCLAG